MRNSPWRMAVRLAPAVLAVMSSACLVSAFHPLYDNQSIVFDEGLIGTWENRDSQITVVIARSEWRSYEITYTERTTSTRFTAFLTELDGARFINVRPIDGQERPAFLVATNGPLEVARDGAGVRVRELDYDEVTRRVAAGTLGTPAATDLKMNVVLTAETPALRKWMASARRDSRLWGDWKVLSPVRR